MIKRGHKEKDFSEASPIPPHSRKLLKRAFFFLIYFRPGVLLIYSSSQIGGSPSLFIIYFILKILDTQVRREIDAFACTRSA